MVAVSFVLGLPLLTCLVTRTKKEVAAEASTERLVQEETTGNIPVAPQNETIQTPIVGDVVVLRMLTTQSFQVVQWDKGIAKTKPRCGFTHQLMEVSIAFAQDMLLV